MFTNESMWATSPLVIIPNRSFSNFAPSESARSKNRQLARLCEMVAQFGEKVALARHESILWARRLIAEQLWLARRFGSSTLLSGEPRAHQRRGRVCGESNYYRVMLC
jgi:hypothetical protein